MISIIFKIAPYAVSSFDDAQLCNCTVSARYSLFCGKKIAAFMLCYEGEEVLLWKDNPLYNIITYKLLILTSAVGAVTPP